MAEATQTPVQKYLDIIAGYDNEFKKWDARVVKILKRYRDDERSASGNEAARFNILWSNVQTLIPAVYSRMPKADVSRRFVDNDPVGRVASLLIERSLDYEIEHYHDFRSAMANSVSDRFLGGRGVAWVRYDPHIVAQEVAEGQITEDVPDPQDQTADDEPEPDEEVEYECSPTDYVYWKDFGHSSARTWEEVTCVWRWVYMTEAALKLRFPDKWKQIPLDSGPQKFNGVTRGEQIVHDRAKVCELWDKETGCAVWLSKTSPELLDERDDPLELEGFFPCPKPLYATTTSDTLVPVPDFALYQDQAKDLDILADRIDGLIKALRVRGIYDASQPTLQRLLTEGDNNTLIGTDKWAAFSEKGGLKGSIDLIPIDVFANALIQCYQAESNIKSTIYEITGISDIVRGQGAASESATAQQIKGQYAGLRLKSMQEGVAMFASELLRLKTQVICSKYQDKTILAYAGAHQMTQEDQAMIPAALQLIRQNPLRSFRIEVAADSLVQLDEQEDKQSRIEFLNNMATFLREAVPAGQQVPELVPGLMAMLRFGVAGFKQARTIEGTLDTALQQMQAKSAQAAQNPQPSAEEKKMQAQMQADAQAAQAKAQADGQLAQVQTQADAQMKQMEIQAKTQQENMRVQADMQLQQQRQQHEAAMKAHELSSRDQFERWKAELDAATKIMVATIGAQQTGPDEQQAEQASAKTLTESMGETFQKAIDSVVGSQNNLSDMHATTMDKLGQVMQTMAAPKRIVRGPDGRAVGVEAAQ